MDDLDEGHDETRRYKSLSHGPAPLLLEVADVETAVAKTLETVKRWQAQGAESHPGSTCVIASTQAVRDLVARQFVGAGFKTAVIDANLNHAGDALAIHFATMHRAKGLEFDHVVVIAPASFLGDFRETDTQRKLIYVALTRAKREAVLLKT